MPARTRAVAAVGRIVSSADFERVLARRGRWTTPHFSLHHLDASGMARAGQPGGPARTDLSTIDVREGAEPVEDFRFDASTTPRIEVGAVVPKRHARRAVTRSLLKRQIYAAVDRQRLLLPSGLWIVRLRAPFARAEFTSAASLVLRRQARQELDTLLSDAVAGSGR